MAERCFPVTIEIKNYVSDSLQMHMKIINPGLDTLVNELDTLKKEINIQASLKLNAE
jgi:hypothetical protein